MNAALRSYGDFSAQIYRRARGGRLPTNGTIELTHRCPLACAHCYNNLPVGDARRARRELSTVEALPDHRRAGRRRLPLAAAHRRRDLRAPRLPGHLQAREERAASSSRCSPTARRSPRRSPTRWPSGAPFAVEITLYGRTRETYERLTGVPGSFDRCMRGIRLLERARAAAQAEDRGGHASTATRSPTMQQFAEGAGRGVQVRRDDQRAHRLLAQPARGAADARRRWSSSMSSIRRVGPSGLQLAARARPVVATPRQGLPVRRRRQLLRHRSRREDEHLRAVAQRQFDLRQGTLQGGLGRDSWPRCATKAVTRPTKCTDCHIRTLCSACAATGELENGDAEAPVEFFCEVAHLRARVVGFTPPAHGACAFCEGGAHHERLLRAGRHRARGRAGPAAASGEASSLKVLSTASSSSCSSGGCGACGAAEGT